MNASIVSLPAALDELAQLKQWVLWRSELVNGKLTKVPYQTDGRRADSTAPHTWCSLEDARWTFETVPGYNGIGFVLSDSDNLVCIDIDCKDPVTGLKVPLTEKQIEMLNYFASTYVETSPNDGYHIWVRATLPKGHPNRLAGVCEVYSCDRFMTMTGQQCIQGMMIQDRQVDVDSLLAAFPQKQATSSELAVPDQLEVNTDGEILTKCAQAANGDKFKKLWEGNWREIEPPYPSNSEADLALCNMLSFWTDNRVQARRLFLQSELGKRPKAIQNATRNINTAFDQKVPPIDPAFAAAMTEQIKQAIQAQKTTDAENRYQDWTLPPGMVGQIAQFIYNASATPIKEVALAGAIALYAGLMGRAYVVSVDLALNVFITLLAKSGQGKESAKKGIYLILKAVSEMLGDNIDVYNYMGPEYIASAQGLFTRISKTPGMVSILPEFGLLLQSINHKHATQTDVLIRRAFLTLYSAKTIGKSAYADSLKNGEKIEHPAFSILGESTHSQFYKSVDEDAINNGLLPRTTIIQYDGDCAEDNKNRTTTPDPHMVQLLQAQVRENQGKEAYHNPTEVKYDAAADKYQTELRLKCKKLIDDHNRNNEDHLAELWSRFHAKVLKLAALIAVGVNSIEPVITLPDMMWAHDLEMIGTNKLIARFQAGDVGVSPVESKHYGVLETVLQSYLNAPWTDKSEHNWSVSETAKRSGVVHSTYISKRLGRLTEFRHARDTGFAIGNVVKRFVEEGKLVVVPDSDGLMRQTSKGGKREGKMYRINL